VFVTLYGCYKISRCTVQYLNYDQPTCIPNFVGQEMFIPQNFWWPVEGQAGNRRTSVQTLSNGKLDTQQRNVFFTLFIR